MCANIPKHTRFIVCKSPLCWHWYCPVYIDKINASKLNIISRL